MSDPDRSKAEGQRYIGCAVATIAEGESGDEREDLSRHEDGAGCSDRGQRR
jgi:hypothetical protein